MFIYRLNDGGRIQITTEGGGDPSWSPDGNKIAFSWARDGNSDIYVVELSDIIGSL
jgi:Tol biopolymer transport system component